MASHVCPKCGGTDFFMSERNVTKGYGFNEYSTTEKFPVCRTCNEIMTIIQSDGEFAYEFIMIVVGLIVCVCIVFLAFAWRSL